MKGPYTTVLRADRDELGTVTASGTLDAHLRAAHFAAGEWIAAELVDSVEMETTDARGTRVRCHLVYLQGEGRLANNIVRQRLS